MAKLGAQIGGGTNTNMHVLFAGKRESSMRDSLAVEKHYRVKELADLWGFSENTIIKLFGNEDGVLRLESPTGKRKYATLSIPRNGFWKGHIRRGRHWPEAGGSPFPRRKNGACCEARLWVGGKGIAGPSKPGLSTPEPGSLMLLSTGLMGIGGMVRRKLRLG